MLLTTYPPHRCGVTNEDRACIGHVVKQFVRDGCVRVISYEVWNHTHILESDVGVVPHLVTDHTNTTIPNKLFDYMAYARPVLVSDAAPMRRIGCQEHCGLYHRSGDVPDIVRKLRTLTDPEVRKRFGARGRQAVVERYNWDRDAERLVTTIGCNRWARRLC